MAGEMNRELLLKWVKTLEAAEEEYLDRIKAGAFDIGWDLIQTVKERRDISETVMFLRYVLEYGDDE